MTTLEKHVKRGKDARTTAKGDSKVLDRDSRKGKTEKMKPLMDHSAKGKGGKKDCY